MDARQWPIACCAHVQHALPEVAFLLYNIMTGGGSPCLQIATEKKEQELRELQRKHGVDGEQHAAPSKRAKAEA